MSWKKSKKAYLGERNKMMDTLTQDEIFALIADINTLADRSEDLVNNSRSTYDRNKQALLNRNKSTILQLENSYKSNCNAISSKANQTIKEAQQMLADIDDLDARLSRVDKYYRKTKEKKESELVDTTSDRYQDADNYFAILEQIKGDYAAISKKYSEDILPALINGINYFFSNKRKKDYEELIILRNTLKLFEKEIEEILPTLTTEELEHQKKAYFSKNSELLESNKRELANLEENYQALLESIENRIRISLDEVLPDELIGVLYS